MPYTGKRVLVLVRLAKKQDRIIECLVCGSEEGRLLRVSFTRVNSNGGSNGTLVALCEFCGGRLAELLIGFAIPREAVKRALKTARYS